MGAHPRVSGENGFAMKKADNDQGSSPRERGKPRQIPAFLIHARLIPA